MTQPLYPTMLQDYLIARTREVSEARAERLSRIKTRAAAAAYVAEVRKKIARCFGVFPKRTPLNPRVICESVRDGYTRQNLLFESRPGYLVSACLYIPDGRGKVPCVLAPCGHDNAGKAGNTYQSFCIGLAKQGYMVIMPDPLSQGERWQYAENKPPKFWTGKRCTWEHNILGKPQRLIGEFFGAWRVWDKMRALDLLLDHPRADKTRVGVTGNSGGGTLSSYLFALDKRLTMAAPGCYITTFRHNIENCLPCDAEQMIPNMLEEGLEMGDLLIAAAPKPVIILSQKYDFFDPRGGWESFQQCRHIYRLLGKERNVQRFVGPDPHGYSLPLREAMYRFFNRHAGVKGSANEKKLGIHPEPEKKLQAAGGDVNAAGSRRLDAMIAETARQVRKNRKKTTKEQKVKLLKKLLRLPKRGGVSAYRVNQADWLIAKNKHLLFAGIRHYLVETQPGRLAVVSRFMQEENLRLSAALLAPPTMELFIPDRSAREEVDIKGGTVMGKKRDEAWIVEPCGMGNTAPGTLRDYDYDHPYNLDFMAASNLEMLGETLMGLRVHDVLCTLDLLAAGGAKRITLTGRGIGAILAKFAGALHKKVVKVNVIDPPVTYHQLTQQPVNPIPWSAVVPDMLNYFDWNEV
ncbi:MAG: acetylxylan esterase [Phycisphaerae bacterium]|nr:acetylxylan esterase [Phycisphaerae bacterium]